MIFSLRFVLSSIAAFAIAAAAGYAFAVLQPLLRHMTHATSTTIDIPSATTAMPTVATPGPELQAPPLAIAPGKASPAAPLPPRDAPITEHYATLAARANGGDVAAARRLADDLQLCGGLAVEFESIQELVGATADDEARTEAQQSRRLDRAEQRLQRYRLDEARCKDSAAWTGEASRWLRMAADGGDVEAGLCFVLFPEHWESQPFSPHWRNFLDEAYERRPGAVRRAFDAGYPEAAAVLSAMYQPAYAPGLEAFANIDYLWTGRLGDDPYWAYAYALIAQRTLSGTTAQRWMHKSTALAARLPVAQRSAAEAWATQQLQRIRFVEPSRFDPQAGHCYGLRRVAVAP